MADPNDQAAKMIANLPEKTGKDLAEWMTVLAGAGLEKHGEMVKLLKGDHGVSHGFANLIVHHFRGWTPEPARADSELIAAQYGGPKADLTPIRDALFSLVTSFGDDVEIAPKKAYASLRRSKQFGIVQPSTRTRVDLGLVMKDVAPGPRLEAAGSFNSMMTHRVRLATVDEVDDEVRGWLREAYDRA